MKMEDCLKFLILLIKCFLILLLFGEYLPSIVEGVLKFYLNKNTTYGNSINVNNIITTNINFMYIFFYNIRRFINQS